MSFAHQCAPSRAYLIFRRSRLNAEYSPRVRFRIRHKPCSDGAKLTLAQSKNLRYAVEILIFIRMIVPIRHGNVEQSLNQVAQRPISLFEHPGNTLSVVFKSCHILACEVEQTRGVIFLLRRDVKHLAKGRHLVTRHLTVGFRHLCTKRNDRNREGDRTLRGRPQPIKNGGKTLSRAQRLKRI